MQRVIVESGLEMQDEPLRTLAVHRSLKPQSHSHHMQLAGDSAFHARAYPPVPPEQSPAQPLLSLNEQANDWDVKNQKKMKQLESSTPNSQDLYDRFQQMREKERKQMESRNLVDNHDVRRSLDDAISFVGTCTEMCPVYERVRREYQRNVKSYERENGKISPNLAVKAFSRPAAGQPPALPSDVRPPSVLVKTLNYLLDNIVPALPQSHPFLWDRTRSIRQDFTYQNYAGPEAVECTETICRIHALCLHLMIGNPDWSEQQELEQFNKSLRTLDEQYSLRPDRTLADCPHEPEIRAMQLLIRIFDAETAFKIESLPPHIVDHQLVQLAMKIRALVHSKPTQPSFYFQFFNLLRQPSTPLLFQIVCQVHFPTIRANLVSALRKSLHKKSQVYNGERFAAMLGFDNLKEALEYFVDTKLELDGDKVNLATWDDTPKLEAKKSWFIDRNLDFSVLRGGSRVLNGLAQPQQLPHQQLPQQPAGTFFKPESLATQKPRKPSLQQTSNVSPAIPMQSNKPEAKVEQPAVAPPQPAPPSQHDIKAFADAEISSISKTILKNVVQRAVEQKQRQVYEQQQAHNRYISGIEKELVGDILHSIAHSTASMAYKAISHRRHSLIHMVVSRFKKSSAVAVGMRKERQKKQTTVNEFILTLKNRSAPKRSQPLESIAYSPAPTAAPTPVEVVSDIDNEDDMSIVEEPSVTKAIQQASSKGANIILLMADWNSPQGSRVKKMFGLGPDYQTVLNNVLITTDSSDRPDITLNFLDRRLANYISFEPLESLAGRVCQQIDRFAPAFKAPKLEEVSVDDSTNVSIFLPSKRSFSAFAPQPFPVKRQHISRPANRAMTGLIELRKLMEESKKLIN